MRSYGARTSTLGHPRHAGRRAARAAVSGVAVVAVLAGLGLPSAFASPSVDLPSPGSSSTVLTGTVERLHLDDFANPLPTSADELAFVQTEAGPVQVPASRVDDVAEGSTVAVGVADAGSVTQAPASAADAADPEAGADVTSVEVLAEPALATTSPTAGVVAVAAAAASSVAKHQVLVVVVIPAGGSASAVSASTIASVVNSGVNNYWTTVTAGAVGFAATAYPSVVTTKSTPCSSGSVASSFTFWDEVAAKVGWVEGPGKHMLVYFKTLASCGGIAGLGTIGTGVGSGGVTWSNGFPSTSVLGHELGHNLGLGHSQELDCVVGGVRVMDSAPANCTKRSYWDTNDIMAVSWDNQGFLNASHLRGLGLVDSTSQVTPVDNGQVTLAPLSTGAGTRILTLSDGANRYVVEYRQAVGLDAWMATTTGWGAPGVTVRREFDATQTGASTFLARESFVLDGDPASADTSFGSIRTVLPVGVWLNLAGGRLGLRINSQSLSGAVIDYRNGAASTDPRYVAPPMPTVSAPKSLLAVGPIRAGATGPTVPLRWSWRVTTPSAVPNAAAALTSATAVGLASAVSTVWTPWMYRASVRAVDGTVVSALGRAQGRYATQSPGASVGYSTGWASVAAPGAVGGAVRATKTLRATVLVRVTARSVGLLLQTGPTNGSVAIYVDGKWSANLNLRAAATSTRVVWSKDFGVNGAHTITLLNATGGASGVLGYNGLVSLV